MQLTFLFAFLYSSRKLYKKKKFHDTILKEVFEKKRGISMRKRLKNALAMFLVSSICAGILLCGNLSTTYNIIYHTNDPEVPITQLSVEKRTKEEIAAMYKKLNIGKLKYSDNKYKEKPLTKKPYKAGVLNDTYINNGLAMLNFLRYVAGVNTNITIDTKKQQYAQAAALIQAINENTGHSPQKPSGMSEEMYKLCYYGSQHGLITQGEEETASAIGTFIDDPKNPGVGHRTTLLDPELNTIGIGMVDDCCVVCYKNEEQSLLLHNSNTAVAWPSYNTPVEFFEYYSSANTPYWSVSFARKDLYKENLEVTVTRKRDKKVWNFKEPGPEFTIDSYSGIISFELGINKYKVGDVYNVKIKGNTINLDYNVNFFSVKSPNRSGTAPAPTVSTKDKTIKYSTLQKKSVSFQIKATAKTPITYSLWSYPYFESTKYKKGYLSGSDYVKVSSSGKVTFKKGAPKGTYKIAIQSTTGTKYYYKSGKKYLTIKVK